MKIQYNKYEIEWANGDKDLVRIPAFLQPSVVKKNLPYSEVRMSIESGFHAYVEDFPLNAGRIDGPAIVKVQDDGKLYYDSIGLTLRK